MNPIFTDQPTTIFEHMSALARSHDAVNLGQGFPDFGWPDDVIEHAREALVVGSNQYPPMRGLPGLRQAIAARHGVASPDQVVVTSGATEALAASIAALVSPGDEVVLFQPVYDSYLPMVRLAGGVPRLVRLTPPDWRLTEKMIRDAITDRTRVVLFNNPHNPTARAFDAEELRLIAEACVRHDAIAISDEVWEELLFDGRRHLRLADQPEMAARTVTIGSAGKIFSLTGWKVGWAVTCDRLAGAIANAHQYVTFATPPALQSAVAYGLGKEPGWFDCARAAFADARDHLVRGLEAAGYAVLPSQGTYFVTVDLLASGIGVDDVTFCERAVREAGVAAIPLSALYVEDPVRSVIRLCFAKRRETIEAGIVALDRARRLFS